MIASGQKTIETRTRHTHYRGPILIVSSKSPAIEPAGYAIATAEIVDCRPMTKEDEAAACCKVYPKAHSWVLAHIRPIKPFPVKGSLGFYDVELSQDVRTAQAKKGKRVWVYCPECMEEWSAQPDEIGELCGYCHEGIAEEGEPAYPTTPEGVFELAKQVFPVTSSFTLAGWLLPDGTLLALTYTGGQRDRDHGEVARLFEDPMERWEAVNRFRNMGAIRVSPYGGEYGIEMSVMPSQEQLKEIRRLLGTAKELEVEIFGVGRDGKFFRTYPFGTPMEHIYRDIRAVFSGNKPSELMQFHNAKGWYRSASAIPRGTFEPLQDITERLSSSLDAGGTIVDTLRQMRELLRPLSNFRHITASADIETDSITLVDDENEEACILYLGDDVPVVENVCLERLDRFQKAASSLTSTPQWKRT